MFEVDIYAERYRGMTRQEQTACLTGHRIIPPGDEQKIMIRAKNIIRKLIWEKNAKTGSYWVHVSFVYPDFGKNRKQVIDGLIKK